MNIVIPMGGLGQRFIDYGFTINKYLLPIDASGIRMIDKAITTLGFPDAQFIYIIREDITLPGKIIKIDYVTEGPACTVALAKEFIDNDQPLIVSNSDQVLDYDYKKFLEVCKKYDGCVMTYQPDYQLTLGASDKHSFIKMNGDRAIQVEEKIVISDKALVGVHYYRSGKLFLEAYNYIRQNNIRAPNGEFYISNTFAAMVKMGYHVGIYNLSETEHFYPVGEPVDFFKYYPPIEKLDKLDFPGVEFTDCKHVKNCLIKQDDNIFTVVDYVITRPSFVVYDIPYSGTININEYFRGWIIGKFSPSLKQADFEVGFLTHLKSEKWPFHYHKEADEYNILERGLMIVNNTLIYPGEIFVFRKGIIACPIFLQDCKIICIKTKSVKNDKYII